MVKILHIISVFAIISTAGVFVLGAVQQLQGANEIEQDSDLTIIEKFNRNDTSIEKNPQRILNPLVEQAQTYALYLNPPKPKSTKSKPTKTRKTSASERRTLQSVNEKITAAESTKLKPKFTLVGISYYRSNPDKSMALVSEPGKGIHWIKKGSNLGHFIVEKIERGKIVYKDGEHLRQMAIDTKTSVPTKQTEQTKLASDQNNPSKPKHPLPQKTRPNTKPRKPMSRLGPSRPEIRPVAYNHSSASG